jgi:hypothetical protein
MAVIFIVAYPLAGGVPGLFLITLLPAREALAGFDPFS